MDLSVIVDREEKFDLVSCFGYILTDFGGQRMSGSEGIYEQKFGVKFDYPVAFTQDLFNPLNPTLKNILERSGPKKHRALICIDSGVY